MSEERALIPVEERIVDFYGDKISAVLVDVDDQQQVFVPLRPICDYLGVAWSGQYERLQRDPVLSEVITSVRVTRTEDQAREMICLPLDYLNGWLFGINASRVKAEIRENLIRYQRECYRVLADAFLRPGEMVVTPQTAAILQIREMGLAITRMADEMLALEQRTATVETRLDRAAAFVGNINKRLTVVEQQVRAGTLTEEQAREIQHRVNLLAQELTKRDPSQKHHPGVYEALRHETGATSYKSIPPKGYEAAIAFLDNWLKAIQEADKEE